MVAVAPAIGVPSGFVVTTGFPLHVAGAAPGKEVNLQQVTESALVHIPIYTFKYGFQNKMYTAAVEAATGRALANIYPAKAEAPYMAVGCATALVCLCLAGILAASVAGNSSASSGIGFLICIGGGLLAAPILFAVASWVASRV